MSIDSTEISKAKVKEKIRCWILSFKKHKGKVSKIQSQIDIVLCRHLFDDTECNWNRACKEAGLDEDKILELPCRGKNPGKKRQKGWYSKKRAEWCKQKAKAWLVHECKECTARDIREAASAFRLNPEALQKYILRQQNKISKKRKRSPSSFSEERLRISQISNSTPISQHASVPNSTITQCDGPGLYNWVH